MAASGHHHVLATVLPSIDAGRGLSPGRKLDRPELFATLLIEGAQHLIGRPGNEDNPALRVDAAAQREDTGWQGQVMLEAEGGRLASIAQRDGPFDPVFGQIDA